MRPETIWRWKNSTSMNSGTKDMLNVASKFMAIGVSLPEVVAEMKLWQYTDSHEVTLYRPNGIMGGRAR